MRRSGKSKPVVWRWQARFMAEGVDGLTRDKTRKPGKPPLPPDTVQRVVDLALGPPPGEATHWTGRMLAKAAGVSLRSVQRILEAHQLAPHRIRTFKLSNDPKFAEKLRDVVGLYVDPPAHAVVLSVDEKSQIQALDRTQPGLPMKKGRAGTMTHDYKRHGTTTLFAALNVLDGTVIGRNMQRHRHQEFIRFLNTVESIWLRASCWYAAVRSTTTTATSINLKTADILIDGRRHRSPSAQNLAADDAEVDRRARQAGHPRPDQRALPFARHAVPRPVRRAAAGDVAALHAAAGRQPQPRGGERRARWSARWNRSAAASPASRTCWA